MTSAVDRFFRGYVEAFNRSLGDTGDVEGIRAHFRDYCATYEKPSGEVVEIKFAVTYFLESRHDTFAIFGFVAGDEMALYRQHGLLPDEPA